MARDVMEAARGPEGNLGYLFRLAHQAFRRRLQTALAEHGLTVAEYSALSAFESRRELSSAELARLLDVTAQTMNTVVHELVRRALLRRDQRPRQGKTLLLRLSAQGRRLLSAATVSVRSVEYAALGDRSAAETRQIKRWLAELAVDELPATPGRGSRRASSS